MNTAKYFLIPTLATSLLVLAGCTAQTATNTNAANDNALPAQTGNVEVAVNTNTDIDTSDWLTYTSEEYGFSFKYPDTYDLSVNDSNIITLSNADGRFNAKIFVREDVITTSMSTDDALRFEDGRELLPLISDEVITINNLLSYRAFRQHWKGDLLYPNTNNTELVEDTWTAVEYNFINENDLIRAWFNIVGDEYNSLVEKSDAIANSLMIR